MKALNDVVVVCDVVCFTKSVARWCEIYIWRDAVDYYVLVVSILSATPKIMDN